MAWSAKLKGGYNIGTPEWTGNTNEILAYWETQGHWYSDPYHYDSDGHLIYTDPKIVWRTPRNNLLGMLGNLQAESGLNPWRWQSDTMNPSGGYGLLQFTPSTKYTQWGGNQWDNATPTPQLSPTTGTPTGTPDDGYAQMSYTAVTKSWVSSAWRDYWSKTTYADLWARRREWLDRYNLGNSITWQQFFDGNNGAVTLDLEAATFFYLACAEGPAVPNLATRYGLTQRISKEVGSLSPVWLYFAMKRGLDITRRMVENGCTYI